MESILALESIVSSVSIKNISNLCEILRDERVKHLLSLSSLPDVFPCDKNFSDESIALAVAVTGCMSKGINCNFISCELTDLQGTYRCSYSLHLSKNVKNMFPFDPDSWKGLILILLKPDAIEYISKENSNRISITVSQQKNVLIIGKLKLFGPCGSIKRDQISHCKVQSKFILNNLLFKRYLWINIFLNIVNITETLPKMVFRV